MGPSTLPEEPVGNRDRVRDEWVAAVDRLIGEAEGWAHRQDWATRREPKRIIEESLGPYEVPRLLIHGGLGRLLLDPIAREIVGADGSIEFCALPSYDGMTIARIAGGWFLFPENDAEGPRLPWSEAAFVESARRLAGSA